jgi:predicted RNase H-like HicB family nuclease
MNFKVKLEQDEDGWFVVTVPSLPGCISQGKTEKEALRNIKEAIELHISALAEDGIPLKEDDRIKETIVSVNV